MIHYLALSVNETLFLKKKQTLQYCFWIFFVHCILLFNGKIRSVVDTHKPQLNWDIACCPNASETMVVTSKTHIWFSHTNDEHTSSSIQLNHSKNTFAYQSLLENTPAHIISLGLSLAYLRLTRI